MNIRKEVVEEVIRLAREYNNGNQIQERENLLEYLYSLSEAEVNELTAIMWVGRGDYQPSDWDKTVLRAGKSSDPGDVKYLAGKKQLALYLSKGLANLMEGR